MAKQEKATIDAKEEELRAVEENVQTANDQALPAETKEENEVKAKTTLSEIGTKIVGGVKKAAPYVAAAAAGAGALFIGLMAASRGGDDSDVIDTTYTETSGDSDGTV